MLKIENLTIGYGKTEVVHHVSLKVNRGEVVTLIGANGAGKSTILNTVVGLHRASSGSISYKKMILRARVPTSWCAPESVWFPRDVRFFPSIQWRKIC